MPGPAATTALPCRAPPPQRIFRARRVTIRDRAADRRHTPLPDLVQSDPTAMDMGGHGRYATVGEYMKVIRMLLNDSAGPHGRSTVPMTPRAMTAATTARATPEHPAPVDVLRHVPGITVGGGQTRHDESRSQRQSSPIGRPVTDLDEQHQTRCAWR